VAARAAQRLEPLDAGLALDTHLEALLAAIYDAGLASGTTAVEVAQAARAAAPGRDAPTARHLLLRGLAMRLTDGYVASAPTLTSALRAYRAEEPRLDWLSVAYSIVAMDLWDDEAWFELVSNQAELARATGALVFLPYVFDYLAGFYVKAGELSVAAGLLTEAESLSLGARAETLPYVALRLAAWRGQAAARSGRHELEHEAVDRLSERTSASGTAWAKGTEARSRALVEDGERADELYRESRAWLGQCRVKAHLARARLSYGEWLRRENRRADARAAAWSVRDVRRDGGGGLRRAGPA
jgi:hypothetical protein